MLAACASRPPSSPSSAPPARPAPAAPGRDGAEANPPADLHLVPDATPRIEPVRPGGPNKPYEVMGQAYVPLLGDPPVAERGLASWYGRKFHGRPTASGEVYDMYAMTAAHRTLPIPSYVRVRNPANGREVVLRVNDRGPFHADRIVDLSYTAALKLGLLGGVAPVELERITQEAIRTGSWRRPVGDTALAAAPQPIEGGSADPIADIARRVAGASEAAAGPAGAAPAGAAPGALAPLAGAAAGGSALAAGSPGGALPAAPPRGFWLQLGAFRQRTGAAELQRQLLAQADWLAPWLAIFDDSSLHRVQLGPYASRDEAGQVAARLASLLAAPPAIVERR